MYLNICKIYFIAYDNMCNLANMKLWREPLPIKSFPNLWRDNLIKIIDSLHLHNHSRKNCHIDFNPSVVKKELPNANTMICEQTFTWLGRFKRFWIPSLSIDLILCCIDSLFIVIAIQNIAILTISITFCHQWR